MRLRPHDQARCRRSGRLTLWAGGAAVAVAEQDILQTLSQVYREKGWSICPEGAACLAAIPRLVEDGLIKPGDKVVVFNTGSLEKYLPDLQHLL